MSDAYKPSAEPRHRDLLVRGLRYRLHEWGAPGAEPVLLLHGWADTGMSFQFLADALAEHWHLVAPDWRGFGDSEPSPGGYWFPDYLGDLDALADHVSPDAPLRIVGHSMGGNVTWLYAGSRGERVSHAASLDAFGLPETDPAEAPGRYRQWLDELKAAQAFTRYDDMDALCERVSALAPSLPPARARFIAEQWGNAAGGGTWELRHDPAHRRINPVLYRRDEARACWRGISARTLLVLGSGSRVHRRYFEEGFRSDVRDCIPKLEEAVVEAGHMLHLEQPGALARILDTFLGA